MKITVIGPVMQIEPTFWPYKDRMSQSNVVPNGWIKSNAMYKI